MINRGLSKKTQYIFNSKTGMLEKKEDNKQTIESVSKQRNKHVKKTEDIAKKENKKKKKKVINQITVITTEDNLIHNYFFDFQHSWDATNCLSIATIKMPKMDQENINYWSTYQGTITIYGGYDFTLDKVNKSSHQTEQEAANSLAQYSENSDIIPFFRGTIGKIKEYQTYIAIYVDSIGVRFKQKIPDEFRQSYINNQNVRDAFQAICEFLGIQYICPPQIEMENELDTQPETDEVETDGTENDVSQQQSTEQNLANTAVNKVQNTNQSLNNQTNSNQQNITSNNNSQSDNQNNTGQNQDQNQEGTEDSNSLTDNKEIDVQLNGYADINFDANGAIVHGSNAIQTSPDMAETLAQLEENPLEKYTKDETGIVEKVQNFLKGDIFEETHNKTMDYGAITIEPKSTTTSEISSDDTDSTGGDANSDPNATGDSSTNGQQSTQSQIPPGGNKQSSNKKLGTSGVSAQGQSKRVLTKAYINSITPSEARILQQRGAKTHEFTDDTMKKLIYRTLGIILR